MKFDWYQASVPQVDPNVVMQALAASDYYGEWVESRPSKGYDIGAQFVVGDQVKYRLNHGGQNAEYGANVTGSGGDAPMVAKVLRDSFPAHRVSRVDSCEDYHHQDAYEYLRDIGLRIAKDCNVNVREIVKPLKESDDGRTLYLGSQTSAISARIYEKGKQLAVDSEWVRVELQVRPQKKVKQMAAYLDAQELWGLAKWSRLLVSELGVAGIKRVDTQIYQPSDEERAYRFMLKQYRKVLESMKATHGSWETVGAQIGYDLEHAEEVMPKAVLSPRKDSGASDK